MYERILVPLDGSEFSEQVLPVTRRLANDLSLPVRLLYAIEPEHQSISQALNERLYYIHSVHHRGMHARVYAGPIRAGLLESGISTDISIPEGYPGNAIVGADASRIRPQLAQKPVGFSNGSCGYGG